MSDTKKVSLTIPQDTHTALTEYAEAKGVTVSEAVAALVKTAVGRRAAVNNYAERQAEARRAEKAAAEKKAKAKVKAKSASARAA